MQNYLFKAWVNGVLDKEAWMTMREAERALERYQTFVKGSRRVRIQYLDDDGQLQLVEDWTGR